MFDTKDEKSVAGGGQGPPLQVHHKSAVVEYHSIGGAEMGQKKRRFDHPVLRVSPSATWDDLCRPQGMELAERYPRQPVEGS